MVAFFSEGEPVKQAYDRFRSIFGGDEALYLVYEAKDGDIFSPEALKAVQGIQKELQTFRFQLNPGETSPLNRITEVKTIINASYLEAKEGALISRAFIGRNIPESESDVNHLKSLAAEQVDYPKLYFSDDYRFGGIMIKTDYNAIPVDAPESFSDSEESAFDDELDLTEIETGESGTEFPDIYSEAYLPKFKKTQIKEYLPFMAEIHKIIDQPKYSDTLKFYPVGNPPLMAHAFKNMMFEMGAIMLGSLSLIIIVLWFLFRSFSAVVWPVLIIICSLVWVMGTVGWSGLAMTEMYNIIVFLVLAVGVADAIHILSGYLFYRNRLKDHQEALRAVYKKSGLACFLTSLTTALGLLSMVFIPIVPLQRFAVFAAIGVMVAFVISVFLLPLMLNLWSPVSRKKTQKPGREDVSEHLLQRFIRKFEHLSFDFPYRITAIFALLSIVLLIGASKVKVESNAIENLKDGIDLKKYYRIVDRHMGGTGNLEVLIDSGMINGFKDPELLMAVDKLQYFLESSYPETVIKTVSLANVVKDSYKALNEGNPDFYRIPDESQLLSQTLFLFENANPKDRRQLVSDDYRLVRVGVNSINLGSVKGLELMEEIDRYIESNLKVLVAQYPDLKVTTTGQLPLQLKLMDYISWAQVKSFGIALGTISIILLIVLGSLKIGIIAIIPNLLPIITAFGVMGYFGIPLDVHTLLVVPIIIGIAVDDTIHFLTHFRLEFQFSQDVKQAILHAYREAGQAIVFTSLVLSIGFLVFTFSSNLGFSYFGILSALSILMATVSDLILLPSLLYLTNRSKAE